VSADSREERGLPWMQLKSGLPFFFDEPHPGDIRIDDIAHALSMLCRFGGHCNTFYSVAEHSVLVSQVVPQEFALQGLLHDATEAYIVDVPRPLKRLLPEYKTYEGKVWRCIADCFALPHELDDSVHVADNAVLLRERDVLLGKPPIDWGWSRDVVPANVHILAHSPAAARARFKDRFIEIITRDALRRYGQ
jgi:hypothetical protein